MAFATSDKRTMFRALMAVLSRPGLVRGGRRNGQWRQPPSPSTLVQPGGTVTGPLSGKWGAQPGGKGGQEGLRVTSQPVPGPERSRRELRGNGANALGR